MVKSAIFLIVLCGWLQAMSAATEKEPSKKCRPVADGFIVAGVDGMLTDSNDSGESSDKCDQASEKRWFFRFDSDVSDNADGLICAGESVEMLPSSLLEKMTTDARNRAGQSYRLWGRVTKYGGRNFIFGTYFVPLGNIAQAQPSTPPKSDIKEPAINEPNDILAIPEDITARLAARKIIRQRQPEKGVEPKTDYILSDRSGFLIEGADGGAVFVLDALGRGMQGSSLELLPCLVLEKSQQEQSREFERLRFKTAGIVTVYKGRYYLLPQRIKTVYSHGNFGR